MRVTRDALAVETPMWMLGDGAYDILDWHDHLLATGVVPVERVVGAIANHPSRLGDGERVTRDAHRRLLWRLFALVELGCNRDFVAG